MFLGLLSHVSPSVHWNRFVGVCKQNRQYFVRFGYRRKHRVACLHANDTCVELKTKLQHCKSARELVRGLSEVFFQQGVPEARLSAEYLVAACIGSSRTQLLHKNPLLSQVDLDWNVLLDYALRRLRREPVQYIVGNWDFHNLTLKVRFPVLIPRPETEELVDKILQFWKESLQLGGFTTGIRRCLEVGCGGGAISLSLLKAWKDLTGKSNLLQVTALDIDPEAVALTRENACHILDNEQKQLLDVRLQDVATFSLKEDKYDFLVSNPPYIPEEEYRNLQPEVVQYESPRALLGGKDGKKNCFHMLLGKRNVCILGMDVIRNILRGAKGWVRKGGTIWLEVDPMHPKMIEEFLHQEPDIGIELLQVFMDMSGVARYCKLLVT